MEVSDFYKIFDPTKAEILILEEEAIKLGDHVDFFYAYFMLEDILYSVNGRFPVQPYYNLGKPDFHDDRVFLKRYRKNGNGYEIDDIVDLGPGGDPRVVSDGKNAYAIIITVNLSEKDPLGASLYDIREKRRVAIRVKDPDFVYGKNWQPYLSNGELFFVHRLTPFRVYKLNVQDGIAELVREADINFKLPQFHSNTGADSFQSFPMFRGGGNALESNGWIYGLGRATSQRYRHHPFFWSARDGSDLTIVMTGFFYDFYRCGFNIIDPTSIFYHNGDLYFGLCCTERDWAHNQALLHLLVVFRGDEAKSGLRLSEFFEERAICEKGGVPNLCRHMFFCIEMPCGIASIHEFGGRVSVGERGHLVHGPYLPVKTEGRFCAELSYLTKSTHPDEMIVGNFEVTACKLDSSGNQIGFETLGIVDLVSTNMTMGEVRIEFEATTHLGDLLEFRVFVEEGVLLNAYHIRTWDVVDTSTNSTSTPMILESDS
ncbi:hypothetical protein I1E95_08170 [Synechococcus sp. CBW1107]|uniref:hypothetical protein n=1 Tax=Synechococcus sp. CBW1107 TaxID=2789857 RepID=UPI0018CF50EB|nr:hypothetical protein [Synechococcus sp. CBW1107]QPN58001.1 hypothetical protein I1E95_08170 [Synechococcus sp. CBW1107]